MKPNILSNSEQTANTTPCYSSYNNFSNDLYCLNANPQAATNQFLSYSNYHHHHDQIMHHHHQYFDENHYIPYIESNYAQQPQPPQQEHQENTTAMQTNNDLYEFLPEEIFQLDQPIVKNEPVMQNGNTSSSATFDTSLIQAPSSSSYNESLNQNFIDLCPSTSEIQNGIINNGNLTKYSASQSSYSEINNNLNYSGAAAIQNQSHVNYNVAQQESPSSSSSVRFHHAYESDKTRKASLSSSYQQNSQSHAAKRDNNNFYLFQQSPSYYLPEIYASSSTNKASNDVMYRSMEKYNYIVNN